LGETDPLFADAMELDEAEEGWNSQRARRAMADLVQTSCGQSSTFHPLMSKRVRTLC